MKAFRLTLFLFCMLLSSAWQVRGEQNLYFSQISTQNGLSQNTVRTILEDRQGFIWAGTLDGLNRYDGYRIFTYKPQLGNPNSLIDHRIKDVYEDRNGYLWLKTYKNEFSCYDPVTDSFMDYQSCAINKDPAYAAYFGSVSNYFEATNGDIWLWSPRTGYLRVSKDGEKLATKGFLVNSEKGDWNCRFLFEDSKSVIWLGTQSGLYSVSEDELTGFYENEYSFVSAVELNNKLFFATAEGALLEYDIRRKTFEVLPENPLKNRLVNVVQYDNTTLLLTTWDRDVFLFNINTRSYEVPRWAADKDLQKGHIDIIIDKNLGIWLYNHTGKMWYWNQEKQVLRKMELIPDDIVNVIDLERYNVFIDSKDRIWITTYGNGLFCYNPESDLLENYKYREDANSPASDYLLAITEDRFGNIWIGSEYAGIIKIVGSNYDIEVLRPESETAIGRNNNVRTVYGDAFGKIWVGTKNGSLYVYNSTLTENQCLYKDINPYALCEDNKKRIWVGTKEKGLYLIDVVTRKEIARYLTTSDSTGLTKSTIFDICRDSKNRIWIATFGGGINLAQESPEGVITFKSFFDGEGNRSYVRYLYQDIKGDMWAATSEGLIRFDPEELLTDPTAYKVYQLNLNEEYSLNCNDVKTIYEDEEGTLWIGTAGGGLSRFVPATAEGRKEYFVAYTTNDGLSGDFISGILEDKNNNLWISTESGITKYDKANNSFLIFNFSDKTYGNHFNENANIIDQYGYMLWGSLDGLLRIDPESFVPGEYTPPVTLTNFYIYDQRVAAGDKDSPLKQSISYSGHIKLNYKQNTFTLEFATLALTEPAKNKYEYMLENYDRQWSPISYVNAATYKNLSPGKYVFKVRGSNSDGIWNDNYTQLDIIIAPPVWKAWYAYLVYFLLTLLALYVAFRLVLKFNSLNNNVKIEKELTNHKLRFFTNISHEFRTPLTLIRGAVENLNEQQDISSQTKRQIDVLNRNSTILTRLIDQLLEFRKLQNNVLTLNLEKTDIIDFSKEIFTGFQEKAIQKKIEYVFESVPDAYDLFIDRSKIDKVLYNLLSNAFKFTPLEGKIQLSVTVDDKSQTCLFKVADNGAGIDKDKQHLLFSRFMQINFSNLGTGVGLSLVKEFVEVHKGKIWYEGNEGQGSVFCVELSTNPDIYKGENFVTPPDKEVVQIDETNKILYPSEDTEGIELPDVDDSTLSNYKMLVIDDNDDIRNFLMEEFSKHFMVDVAEDGEKGFQKAVETNPDLIICDVMMPGIDGFEVTRRLKSDFQTCHIPIVLLTAHSSIEHQLEGIQSGADAYVMKPFSLKYLVTRVFKLIEHREQLKKRFSKDYILDGNLITNTDKDKAFFEMIDGILEEHLGNTQFSVDMFAELAQQKRTVFYKKVRGLTGMSPNELIKVKRLKRAAEMLLTGDYTVAEVSYNVGYDDPFYFSKSFKSHYKCSPSKYGQQYKAGKDEAEDMEDE